MPFSLLIAIFIAFGFDFSADNVAISAAEVHVRSLETLGLVVAVGIMAFALSKWVAVRVAWHAGATAAIRHSYGVICRVVDILTLIVYAWIIYGVDWRGVVERGLGLRNAILVDEFLILLPFLVAQFLSWWGLYAAESALRASHVRTTRGRYLILRARQALGLVLPVALIFSLGQDLFRRQLPEMAESPSFQLGWMAVMGTLVLILAPAFVRLTWPTQPLSRGPLRDRLERLSKRFRFRCTDILVWDTGQALVNAGVTGALPWFRYVLLTDALVEHLTDHQVEAVFGHEVGHISHRHLSFFGFFFLGSVGVLALAREVAVRYLELPFLTAGWWTSAGGGDSPLLLAVHGSVALICLALYFLFAFGYLSRRFERQADVFGCRAVSCGSPDCPPHADLNANSGADVDWPNLCPAGIRIFASALSDVASLNGMERESWWAWRHGSIGRRIAFLEALEGKPHAERRFQRNIQWLRGALVVALATAVILAMRTGALAHLH